MKDQASSFIDFLKRTLVNGSTRCHLDNYREISRGEEKDDAVKMEWEVSAGGEKYRLILLKRG